MASIRKRGTSWTVQVQVNGRREFGSFDTKAQAQAWANTTEYNLRASDRGEIPTDKTFKDLLDRYAKEVSPTKKGEHYEQTKIKAIIERGDPITKVKLHKLSPTDVAAWRDVRLTYVSADSVLREWTLFSHACTVAKKDWHWLNDNPFKDARRPKPGQARERRFEGDELDRLLIALGTDPAASPTTATARVGFALLFAIETAMRCGEICKLEWSDIEARVAKLHDTKNGYSRAVPLSSEARRLISLLPADSDKVFNLTETQVDAFFRKARARALIDGVRFHDSRREALTRLSQKVDVMTLAKISGHRDLRILQNTYYAPRMDEVAGLLD